MPGVNKTKDQILLYLYAGVALSLSPSPIKQARILKQLIKELRKVELEYIRKAIYEFRNKRLIEYREAPNGEVTMVLSDLGRKRVIKCNLDKMRIVRPHKWDGKWRLVFFDVPEKKRLIRDSIRCKLQELGFVELQKSIFVHPFANLDEIDFIIEALDGGQYVRRGEMQNISNESELKLKFNLV